MGRVTATEASRNFSAILNRAAAGERIEVTRAGAVVAVIAPPFEQKKRFLTHSEFREHMQSVPKVDADFLREIEEIRKSVGPPSGSPWDS